jgi:preprotein translocase subunit SecG
MSQLIIVLILIAAVLLVVVVLAQNSKGGGLSSTFGGSASQLMGAKRTMDFLEKLTWGFAIFILAFSLLANVIVEKPSGANFTSPNVEAARDKQVNTGTEGLPVTSEDANTELQNELVIPEGDDSTPQD